MLYVEDGNEIRGRLFSSCTGDFGPVALPKSAGTSCASRWPKRIDCLNR